MAIDITALRCELDVDDERAKHERVHVCLACCSVIQAAASTVQPRPGMVASIPNLGACNDPMQDP